MTPELIEAATDLAALLAEENAALTRLDLGRAAAMADPKRRAVAAFVGAQGRAAIESAGPSQRSSTETLARELQSLASENKRLLERATLVQGRVVATIARAIPQALPGAQHYGAGGRLALAGPLRPVALSARA